MSLFQYKMEPLYGCVAPPWMCTGPNVPYALRMRNEAKETQVELQEFGSFKREHKAMAKWVASFQPQQVVMERTGI
uniref:Uncharacterized protein n=1 Tax=Candidatus Kentrum sp. TC TaxID=2126339 RepID=A0A451A0Y4_9GAMM|nr:MAG: hypothetical protein BECKTC1821F_GA0114240_10369 [Candidatus Kentron sp. TC]